MKWSTKDILILITLLPVAPVVVTWWLPWESWIPKRIPKYVLGPYLLYLAFAAWHFRWDSFFVIALIFFGVIAIVGAVFDKLTD